MQCFHIIVHRSHFVNDFAKNCQVTRKFQVDSLYGLTGTMSRSGKIPVFQVFGPGNRDFLRFGLFVKSWVGEVDVLLIHALFGQSNRFTEVINLSKAIEPVVPQRIHGLFDILKNRVDRP